MSEQRYDQTRPNHLRNSAWIFGAAAAILAGLLFIGSALATAPKSANAAGWGRHWGHDRGGHDRDPGEHAELAVEWVLRWVDGTPEQVEQITAIAKASIDELSGLKEEHHQRHQDFVSEMSKTTVDGEAIERLRSDGMGVADTASVHLVKALIEAASILTLEQRLELIELAERFHRR
jgi:protein CpxP